MFGHVFRLGFFLFVFFQSSFNPILTMSTHYKKHLFKLNRIKNIDFPEPTTKSHLLQNQTYSILTTESKIDLKKKKTLNKSCLNGEKTSST